MCDTVSSIMSGLETRSLGQHIRHNVISSLVTVCPSRSSFHRFLGLTSTKQRVHVTCSRPQRNVHRRGIEPGTPWSEIRRPIHCATPPHWPHVRQDKFCLRVCQVVFPGYSRFAPPIDWLVAMSKIILKGTLN